MKEAASNDERREGEGLTVDAGLAFGGVGHRSETALVAVRTRLRDQGIECRQVRRAVGSRATGAASIGNRLHPPLRWCCCWCWLE